MSYKQPVSWILCIHNSLFSLIFAYSVSSSVAVRIKEGDSIDALGTEVLPVDSWDGGGIPSSTGLSTWIRQNASSLSLDILQKWLFKVIIDPNNLSLLRCICTGLRAPTHSSVHELITYLSEDRRSVIEERTWRWSWWREKWERERALNIRISIFSVWIFPNFSQIIEKQSRLEGI